MQQKERFLQRLPSPPSSCSAAAAAPAASPAPPAHGEGGGEPASFFFSPLGLCDYYQTSKSMVFLSLVVFFARSRGCGEEERRKSASCWNCHLAVKARKSCRSATARTLEAEECKRGKEKGGQQDALQMQACKLHSHAVSPHDELGQVVRTSSVAVRNRADARFLHMHHNKAFVSKVLTKKYENIKKLLKVEQNLTIALSTPTPAM